MEEDSLPPTPVVPATSPLGGVLEKHAGQVPVSHTFFVLSLLLKALLTVLYMHPDCIRSSILLVLRIKFLYETLYYNIIIIFD